LRSTANRVTSDKAVGCCRVRVALAVSTAEVLRVSGAVPVPVPAMQRVSPALPGPSGRFRHTRALLSHASLAVRGRRQSKTHAQIARVVIEGNRRAARPSRLGGWHGAASRARGTGATRGARLERSNGITLGCFE
jgi:hypothetical protein